MNRRRFVTSLAGTAGGLACGLSCSRTEQPEVPKPDPAIKRVLVMFKCHLDVGFVDTQAAIIRKYFDQYFPQAIRTAQELRQAGKEGYVWTTGSGLVFAYLEQATPENRKRNCWTVLQSPGRSAFRSRSISVSDGQRQAPR